MKYELVIFDLDGTLVDTIDDLGTAVNHALALNGLPLHDMEEYRLMVGNGVRKLVHRAMPEALKDDPELLDRLLAEFIAYYSEHTIRSIWTSAPARIPASPNCSDGFSPQASGWLSRRTSSRRAPIGSLRDSFPA